MLLVHVRAGLGCCEGCLPRHVQGLLSFQVFLHLLSLLVPVWVSVCSMRTVGKCWCAAASACVCERRAVHLNGEWRSDSNGSFQPLLVDSRVSGKITDKHDMSGREWRGVVVWTHFDNQPPESKFLVRIVEIAV